jgi:hypothetical protein
MEVSGQLHASAAYPRGKCTEFFFHLINYKLIKKYEGFEVLTAVVMKSSIFWDITPYIPLKSTDISEEHFVSILRIEEGSKKETSVKQIESRASREQSGS